jgi:hypothetical protein
VSSQALARLRWSDEVVSGDVDEAIRLMMMSKVMVVAVVLMKMIDASVAFCLALPPSSSHCRPRCLSTKNKRLNSESTQPWAFSK